MSRKKKRDKFKSEVIICIALIVCTLMLGTIAYLQREAELSNSFTVGNVEAEIEETFKDDIKTDVSIRNTGNVDAYIRAKILIYFVDSKGNITGEVPVKDVDYTITMGDNINSSWINTSDCYYFTKSVAPGANTDILIKECKQLNSDVYEGGSRRLVVDIVAEAIQANDSAVNDAWKSVVSENGQLKPKVIGN